MIAHYHLHFDLLQKIITVTLTLNAPAGALSLRLPAWIPGSYMIRDFARHIISLKATDASDKPVVVTKTDKQTWSIAAPAGVLHVRYQVYANDPSVRGAHIDQTHAFFNGTTVFLQPLDVPISQYQIALERPNTSTAADWQVATMLEKSSCDAQGFGTYQADSYTRLIDCPVEMAQLDSCSFTVAGVPHQMVFSGSQQADLQRLAADLPPALAEHIALFGELPVPRYLFLTRVTAKGYGGLEHADSTALMCARKELPYTGMRGINDDYQRYLGLCSHEYFHLWNVKRIQPRELQHADLAAESHTSLLWAFEGITSYYDDLALLRAGVIDLPSYLKTVAQSMTRVQRGPGRLLQSVADSSFDAWTKFYQQDENAPNAIVSYYTKGALVAFGLDVEMRLASQDRVSLDDLMRELWQRYGRTGLGVEETAITALCSELTGVAMDTFFADYVYGVKELPLAQWCAALGLGYRLRQAHKRDDSGGYLASVPDSVSASDSNTETPVRVSLDVQTVEHAMGARLTTVYSDGVAQGAGLAAGDIVIALNGEQVTHASLDDQLARLPVDASVQLHAFRDGILMTYDLVLAASRLVSCELWLLPEDQLDAACRARHHHWRATKGAHLLASAHVSEHTLV